MDRPLVINLDASVFLKMSLLHTDILQASGASEEAVETRGAC